MLVACKSCHRQYDLSGMKPGEGIRCRCAARITVPESRPREAQVLRCSACGGKLRDKAATCDYCGSEIVPSDRHLGPACPECFARMPEAARFCCECGIEIHPEAIRTTREKAPCPRCRGQLVLRELEQGHYTECTACAGIWLDAQSFDRAIEKRDVTSLAAFLATSGSAGPAPSASRVEPVKYVPCPVCARLMNRKNFGGCSGVIVDWCKGHGFWFDAGEMERVISFVGAGGLDRARELEILHARQEIAHLEEQKRAVASSPGQAWPPFESRTTRTFDGALSDVFTFFSRLLG